MTGQTHRILIGSCGWQHEGWQDSYYPADLPSEWRLGYYSNEFPLAVVTERERAQAEDLPGEMADCREDLWVLVSVTNDAGLESAVDLLQQLPRQGGVLLQVDPAACRDPDAWLAQIAPRLNGQPLCVDPVRLLNEAWRDALRARSIGWSWNSHSDADGLALGPLAVIRVDGDCSARQLRDYLEAGLAVSRPTRDVALVIDGQPPDVETLRQAKQIEELL
ncbi:hypothetical protein [Thiohalophilus sp.]|uniref:hypothetical protein n=1 Tax=Thiohalophilus sp. TaxID=3028392 RepID=UPI002ACE923E|nr:hypothetical protein [Thiohalophilus sp.]MDZ7662261.1 hypothetical protein [Thiohalophilus sp.]